MDIAIIKANLKKSITKNIKNTLDYLEEITSSESVIYDEIILFSNRNIQNNKSLNLNIISINDYRIEQNRITKGVLELINRIDYSHLINSKVSLENKRRKFINKVNNVKIKAIEFQNQEINHKKAFYINLVKLSILLILPGGISFFLGVSHLGEGLTNSKTNFLYIYYLVFFIGIGILASLHYRRYLKQKKDWESIWKDALELTISGEHNSIMDTLFHTLNEFGFKIKKYNIENGQLIAKKWWWGHTRIVNVQKILDEDTVLISIDYLYPSAILMQEGTNKMLLSKLQKKLLKNFEY